MSTLVWIMAASIAGALLSVFSAAVLALRASANQVPMLISYAIGALLGAVFLQILPHAFDVTGSAHRLAAVILGGILFFFTISSTASSSRPRSSRTPGWASAQSRWSGFSSAAWPDVARRRRSRVPTTHRNNPSGTMP